ncbi:MAG: DUF4388 domain-containing protein, partial [Planctomycetota bacterium]
PAMVLQFINTCSLTGMLKFVTINNVASFYFRKGDLVHTNTDTKKKIGEYLVDKELITRKQLSSALQAFRHEKGFVRVGEILIERGYISKEALSSVIQEQMREVVFEVINWKEGGFLFFNNVAPQGHDILIDQQLDYLLLEGCRRADEKSYQPHS